MYCVVYISLGSHVLFPEDTLKSNFKNRAPIRLEEQLLWFFIASKGILNYKEIQLYSARFTFIEEGYLERTFLWGKKEEEVHNMFWICKDIFSLTNINIMVMLVK